MILDSEQLGRVIIFKLMLGAALYYFSPIASFAYFVCSLIIASIQNYRAWETVNAHHNMIKMYREKVPELDKYINKVDNALGIEEGDL
jgi:hypothetical protein